jgi:hypothetical protein
MGGFFDTVGNILTGGLSNVAGVTHDTSDLTKVLGFVDPLYNTYQGIEKYQKTWDWGAGLDRAIDPGWGETGFIDYGIRGIGDELPYELRSAAPTLGSIVGGIVGSYVPVLGTAVGAAIGSGVGNKLKGGNKNKDYRGDIIKSGTTYVASKAGEYALGDLFTTAGQDELGGGLTGEYAALAGPEYGYNSYGEGVGTIAQYGYPTGTEAANVYDPNEYGQTVDSTEMRNINYSPEPEQVKNIPQETWYGETWSKIKEISSKNASKLGDIGKALSISGGEMVEGGVYASGGSPTEIASEEARIRRLSNQGLSKPSKAKNLFDLEEQKKTTPYDLEAAIRELANYKKKEEEEYVYL